MTTETITIKVPATVAARVVGVDRQIDVSDLAAESLAYAFTYGVRRLYQDNGNAVAKAARDEGKEPDADAIFNARHEQMTLGEFNTRAGGSGETFTPLELMVYDVAIEIKGGKDWKPISKAYEDAKGLTTSERRRMILDAVDALPPSKSKKIVAVAERRIKDYEALAL